MSEITGAKAVDLASILSQAGGAGAIARQLGVEEPTVESGASALLPHVVTGIEAQGLPGSTDVQSTASQGGEPLAASGADAGAFMDRGIMAGGGLGGLLGGLTGGAGGGLLGSLVGGGVGNQILGHIFGSKEGSRQVASQASQQSGVDPAVLKKLLPIVAGAVAMHYITHRKSGTTGGPGAPGGGGGILGSILGQR